MFVGLDTVLEALKDLSNAVKHVSDSHRLNAQGLASFLRQLSNIRTECQM